jgi:hypothetical protein
MSRKGGNAMQRNSCGAVPVLPMSGVVAWIKGEWLDSGTRWMCWGRIEECEIREEVFQWIKLTADNYARIHVGSSIFETIICSREHWPVFIQATNSANVYECGDLLRMVGPGGLYELSMGWKSRRYEPASLDNIYWTLKKYNTVCSVLGTHKTGLAPL